MFRAIPEKFIPTKDQLAGLYSLLNFLCDSKIEWNNIGVRGGRIIVKAEPPKGEIDIRVFYIDEEGRINDDDFREFLQKFD